MEKYSESIETDALVIEMELNDKIIFSVYIFIQAHWHEKKVT